ncbi:MAG: carbohydrate kinase family protein [Firmicutes bacterium]|nr:carbohydrate kinase family protein [Candidatus Alectryobacillus merdavium]
MDNIAIIGNAIVDNIKTINSYPKEGMLVNINYISSSVGGCLCNAGINLKTLDKHNINVVAFSKVGNDFEGEFILNTLKKYQLDISNIIIDKDNIQTGFTDVMTSSNGNRTFFHFKGTNKTFCINDINLDYFKNNPCLVHIGYLMLLDWFDLENKDNGTNMAQLLSILKSYGCKISIDLVSEDSPRFIRVVKPSLKYIDYLIINEVEASLLSKINVRDIDNNLIVENIKQIMILINKEFPNIKKIIIHSPEIGIILENNKFYILGSLILPKDFIKGSVGAGDAFAAGCLYGIANNFDNYKILKIASSTAANNLTSYDSISSAKSYEEIIKLDNLYKRLTFKED